jgi:ATP-dependent Zn protease
MIEQYPRGTAFHEAGHAVVAHFLGHEVVHIHISNDDESGRTDITAPVTRMEHLTFLFAGMAAQNIFSAPSKHQAGLGDVVDFLNLMAKEGVSDDEREALRQDAYQRANITLHAHRAEVEAVAARLMEHGPMDGPQFLEVMRSAELK